MRHPDPYCPAWSDDSPSRSLPTTWGPLPDGHPRNGTPNSPSPGLWRVSPLRRRSNTPLVQDSAQSGRTPSKIRLNARHRNFTNQKLRRRMFPRYARPAPDGRGHFGAPLPYAPDLTDTSAYRAWLQVLFLGFPKQRRWLHRLRRRSSFWLAWSPPKASTHRRKSA